MDDIIVRGKRFNVKYENGIVYIKHHENLAWVSAQNEPIEGLDKETVMDIARDSVFGLGLI